MSLRELYSDNGANGDNERDATTLVTRWAPSEWNPIYCANGWPHRVLNDKCTVCDTVRLGADK